MGLNIVSDTADEELHADSHHLCWIYENDGDRARVVKPYLISHLARRNQCLLVVPKVVVDEIIESLRNDNFDVDHYLESGQLITMEPEALFFSGGPFDVDVIMHRMEEARRVAIAAGWHRLAAVVDASELLDRAEDHDWLAVEFRTDFECMAQPCSVLCLFDARKASGTFIASVIKVHPVIGLGRGFAHNPFYGQPAAEIV